jgi:hypothetical protein
MKEILPPKKRAEEEDESEPINPIPFAFPTQFLGI